MKRFPLVLLATAAWALPAAAADAVYEQPPAPPAPVEVAPAYSWSGLYVGGQLGVAFNNGSTGVNFNPGGGGVATDVFGDDSNASFVGGVHIGYDYQVNNWVFGALADISYLDANVNRGFTIGGNNYAVNQDINYFGTVRGKLGYAFNRFLVYGTGGLAYANSDTNFSGPAAANFSNDDSDFGYTVGGGVDYLLTQKLSFGVEYLYTNLGSNDFSFSGPNGAGGTFTADDGGQDVDFHTVWAKLSYHF